jgi:hypothetical protein
MDVAVTEGNAGTTSAVFTVSLSTTLVQTVTVGYATVDGTATAGSDYTARTGTLTFAPGTTTQSVTVPVTGDNLDENDETFNLTLSGAVGATIEDSLGVGSILDDDAPPTASVSDVSVKEGNSGRKNWTFVVTLSAPSGKAIDLTYATTNGSATAGTDYRAVVPTTLSLSAGQVSKTVDVRVNGDRVVEPNEVFYLDFTNPLNVTVLKGRGIGTIVNDDR